MVLLLVTAPYSLILLVALRLSRNIGNLVLWGLTFFSQTNKKSSLRSNPKTVGNISRFSSRKKTTSLFFLLTQKPLILYCDAAREQFMQRGAGGAWIHLIQSEKNAWRPVHRPAIFGSRPWLVKRGSLGYVLHVNSTAWLAPVLSVIVIITDTKP